MPTFNGKGGQGDVGTMELGGVQMDVAEIAVGATREETDRLIERARDPDAVEQTGIDNFNEEAGKATAEGAAFRALAGAQMPMAESEVVGGDLQDLRPDRFQTETQALINDSFADCSNSTAVVRGQPIIGRESEIRTCSVGASGASCSRSRDVLVVLEEDRYIQEPGSQYKPDQPRHRLIDQLSFNGQCEADAASNECRVRWQCTDSEPREIDGVLVNEQVALEAGFQPLYPGAPALCWEAKALVECPVCIEDEYGNKRQCSMVDVSQAEGNTCGQLEQSGMCRFAGTQCLLEDENGQCVTQGRTYSCDRQIEVPTTEVRTVNTCGIMDDDEQPMSFQAAMAQMAVADAIHTDLENSFLEGEQGGVGSGGGNGGGNGSGGGGGGGGNQRPGDDAEHVQLQSVSLQSIDRQNEDPAWGYEDPRPDDVVLDAASKQFVSELQLFKGSAFSCQKGYGGLVNCCKATDSNAKELFWEVHTKINAERAAKRALESGEESGFRALQSGRAGMSALSTPFTSMRDRVLGGGSAPTDFDDTSMSVWEQFMGRARAEIKPSLSPSWVCNDAEFDLAVQREIGSCSYAGTYCSKRVLGACLKKKESYCCYKSPMTKMLRESAEPGGVLTHGSAKRPDCSGLPLDEIERIDWSVMDFNSLAANMSEGGVFERLEDPEHVSEELFGTGATLGNAGRQDVGERTMERVTAIDTDAVNQSIAEDIKRTNWVDGPAIGSHGAVIQFASTFRAVQSGSRAAVALTRSGSKGSARARVSLYQGDPGLAGFNSDTVQWQDGEIGDKHITLNPPAGTSGQVTLHIEVLQGEQGGNSLMVVEIR